MNTFNLLDVYTYEDFQLSPGPHTFEVRAIDETELIDPSPPTEGNVDPTPATYTWTMVADTEPPRTGIVLGPEDGARTGLADIEWEFFALDNATPTLLMEYECSVDGHGNSGLPGDPEWEPCSTPSGAGGLLPGEHTFRVRGIDLAGNADPTPAMRTFTVVAMPISRITSGPGELVPETDIILSDSDQAAFVFGLAPGQPDAAGRPVPVHARRGRQQPARRRPVRAVHLAARVLRPGRTASTSSRSARSTPRA